MKYSILSKYDEVYQAIHHSEIVHQEKLFKNFDLSSTLDESSWNKFYWNEKKKICSLLSFGEHW